MKIVIPDKLLEPMKGMPTIFESEKYKWIKDGDVLTWIGKSGELCVANVIIRQAMMRQAEKLGLIKYNPETKSWQGVDYNGN